MKVGHEFYFSAKIRTCFNLSANPKTNKSFSNKKMFWQARNKSEKFQLVDNYIPKHFMYI